MGTPTTPLDKFFRAVIEWAGSLLPQRTTLQFLGNVTIADNANNDSTDVTVGSGGSIAPIRLNAGSGAGLQLSASQANTLILLDTLASGGFTVKMPTTGLTDGMRFPFKDPNGNWGTASPQVQDLTPRNIEHPIASGTWPSNSMSATLTGGNFALTYDQNNNRWMQTT